jgi:hypothetical protein
MRARHSLSGVAPVAVAGSFFGLPIGPAPADGATLPGLPTAALVPAPALPALGLAWAFGAALACALGLAAGAGAAAGGDAGPILGEAMPTEILRLPAAGSGNTSSSTGASFTGDTCPRALTATAPACDHATQ